MATHIADGDTPVDAAEGVPVDVAGVLSKWDETLEPTLLSHQTLQVDQTIIGNFDSSELRAFNVGASSGATIDVPKDFEIMDVLGEGGMGLVYQARQNSLGRSVALKMMKQEHAGQPQARDLFLAEAILTSRLDHPNIVPIHELGMNDENQLFYSMKEVKGTPWSKKFKEQPLNENLAILDRIADGVAFAHVHGVIHRDLKPDNVMLGGFGEVLLLDWGLAVRFDTNTGRSELTPSTALAGTPIYMAPEMARGDHQEIGPQSDIYLLGAILFHMVTGVPPHAAASPRACLQHAVENKIVASEVNNELVDIARKAMATRPADRYRDVAAFQKAVRTYQSHRDSIDISERAKNELLEAQRSNDYKHYARSVFGFQEAITSWGGNEKARVGLREAEEAYARCALSRGDLDLAASLIESDRTHHPALYGAIQAAITSRDQRRTRMNLLKRTAAALVLGIVIILTVAIVWVSKERDRALVAKEETRQALIQAEHQNYFNLIALAGRKIDDHHFDQAAQLLADTPPQFRGWEWGYLQALCHQDLHTFTPAVGWVRAVAYAPDARAYAHGSEEGLVLIRKVQNDEVLFSLAGHSSQINDLAYSPDGKYLASASNDKTIRVWDVNTGVELLELAGQDYVNAVAFHPDSRQLVSGSADKLIRLWNIGTRQVNYTLKGHTGWITSVAFDATGDHLLSGSRDGTARWWDLKTHQSVFTLPGPAGEITAVAVAPHGRLGFTGSDDGSLQIWNFGDGSLLQSWPAHPGGVTAVAWHPATAMMLSAGKDNEVRQWSAPGEASPRAFAGHLEPVLDIASTRDGSRILTGSADGEIKFWDASRSSNRHTLSGHEDHVNTIAYSPDGRWIATGSWDETARIWYATTGEPAVTLEGHDDIVRSVAFSPDSQTVLTGSWDSTTRVWQVAGGELLHAWGGHEDMVHAAVYNHRGSHILTGSADGTARYGEADTGIEVHRFTGHTNWVTTVAVSPDDRFAATGGRDARVILWDLQTGAEIRRFEGHEAWVSSVAFSPDGSLLLSASQDQTARLWSVADAALIHELRGHGDKVHSAAFSPAGDRLLTGGDDQTARLWDVKTGREMITLRGYQGGIYATAFHPNGLSIGLAGLDNVGRIWTALPWGTLPAASPAALAE